VHLEPWDRDEDTYRDVLAERIYLLGAFGDICIRCSDDVNFYRTEVHVHDNRDIAQKLDP
jgi:hypothetical protein